MARKTEKASFRDVTGTEVAVFGGRHQGESWAQVRELEVINEQLHARLRQMDLSYRGALSTVSKMADALNLAMAALQTGSGKCAAVAAIRRVMGEA